MSSEKFTIVHPPHFARPRGYSNGIVTHGPLLHIAGQIGWQPDGTFATDDFVEQFAQALDNVVDVVKAAGGTATNIVRMTVYVTNIPRYRTRAKELGPIWKNRFGKHYPAMSLVGVTELVEQQAQVEIEALAYLPEESA